MRPWRENSFHQLPNLHAKLSILLVLRRDAFLLQPAAQVFKREHHVQQFRMLRRLQLFGDARANEPPDRPSHRGGIRREVSGAVSVPTGEFVWRHQAEYFNAETHLSFVDEELLP